MACENNRNMALIVGISGATNSGKSSLTKKLLEHFPGSFSFCQDDYFLDPDSDKLEPIPHLNCANWDVLSALDTAKMMTDIQKWLEMLPSTDQMADQVHLLVVDGFLIFNYKPLCQLFDIKYFITISKEICQQRRSQRIYNPPDCPGYFEHVAWPYYLKNKAELSDQKDIIYLNGDENMESNFQKIQDTVTLLLETQKKSFHLPGINSW